AGKRFLYDLVVSRRRLRGSLTGPDQDSAVLVACQLLGFDEFDLEIFEVSIIEVEAPLQGTIRDASLALQQGNSLLQNGLELHAHLTVYPAGDRTFGLSHSRV